MTVAMLSNAIMVGLLRGGLYALMAVGLSLIFGVMHVFHFAHGELYMVGAYLSYFAATDFGLSPLLAIGTGALGAFVVGVVLEKVFLHALRRRCKENWVMNTFLLTLGISLILRNVAQLVWGTKYRGVTKYFNGSVRVAGMTVSADRGFTLLIAIVAIVALGQFLARTRIGRATRAVADDEQGAMLVGINLDNIHTLTFALSSMLAGLAGASLLFINPAFPSVGARPTLMSWYVVTLAGLGNVNGSIVGGFIIGIVESLAYHLIGEGWPDVISICAITLILSLKPSGLFGTRSVES